MTLETAKEMDKRCVVNWLIEVYVTPSKAFDKYTEDELKMFAYDAIVLLKEQEPIEPRNTYSTTPSGKVIPHIFCGKCNKEIYTIYAFCPFCGQAVKWND